MEGRCGHNSILRVAVRCFPTLHSRLSKTANQFIKEKGAHSMSNTYFPRWRKVQGSANGAVVQPDEYMPWPQNVAMGAQHVVAIFGSTILAPLLKIGRALLGERVGTYVEIWVDT